jgi:GH15 family glucan-1,4-alpha-glucosidase
MPSGERETGSMRKDVAMDRYPDIGAHGLIGYLQTAALVSTDGAIDWFCCPRFDSPSVFASLLDHDRGGNFRIGPDRDLDHGPGWVEPVLSAGRRER